jgi:SAM-dependent methyltransferase
MYCRSGLRQTLAGSGESTALQSHEPFPYALNSQSAYEVNPVQQAVLEKPSRAATPPLAIWCWHLLARLWYPVLTRFTKNSSLVFLNYGYCSDEPTAKIPELNAEDEPDRSCIQLYDRVLQDVDLAGMDVLEISCGHGGGTSYMARYCRPKSVHGVDRNPQAIKLCKDRHPISGLTFSHGDAMSLALADESMDAVVNVEASHCYSDMAHFLREIIRILRPGGYFLYADFRHGGADHALLQSQVEACGLEIIRHENISLDVVRGMELNSEKYATLIAGLIPRQMRKPAMNFAGLKGSPVHSALESGETVYFAYTLRKAV